LNFLAHFYLSGNNHQIMIGNFIADSVKGTQYRQYSSEIQKGILLHRSIDLFTDNHLLIKEGLKILRPHLGKFSGVALDIFLDHFLALQWDNYHKQSLRKYTFSVMEITKNHLDIMPQKSVMFYNYAVKTDRLYTYKNLSGMEEVFTGMNKRILLSNNLDKAPTILLQHYEELNNLFLQFFPEIKQHANEYLFKINTV